MSWSRATSRDFSFGGNRTPENVGPGSYNISNGIQTPRSQSACFKSADYHSRDIYSTTSIITPAPCDYVQTIQSARLSSTSTFKSRSKRELYNPTQNPGPCEHSEIKNWGSDGKRHSSSMSISKLNRARPISGNVGQDVLGYEINEDGNVVNAVKKLFHGQDWVGPGSYSPEDPSATSPRIHSLRECYRKNKLWEQNDNPGPGQYSPDNPDQRYMRKISQKYESEKIISPKSEGLSPIDWSTGSSRPESSIFKSKTARKLYEQTDVTPSPVAYQSSSSNTRKKVRSSSAFGQRSARFDSQRVEGPGPGQYEAKSVEWGKKGNSLVRRAVDKYNPGNDVPGPGTYRPVQDDVFYRKDNRPTSNFASQSKRGWDDSNANPGPGSYNLRPKSGKVNYNKNTIRASRFKETNNFMYNPYQDNPSPADYQQIESPLKKRRGRSISRSDRFDYRQNDNPGPGSYEIVHSSFIKKSCHADFRGMS